jgi:hypothetical protein
MAESLLHRLSHNTLLALAHSSLEMVILPAFSLVVAQCGVSDCCYLLVAGSSSLWVSQSPPVGGPTLTVSEPLNGSILKSAQLVGTLQPARMFTLSCQKVISVYSNLLVTHVLDGTVTGDIHPELGECVGFIRASANRCVIGELGLFESQPRSATVRTEDVAVLLKIQKREFDKYIKNDFQADFKLKLDALRLCSEFADVEELRLRRMSLDFRLKRYGANSTIYKEDDPIRECHVLVSGSCAISRLHEVCIDSQLSPILILILGSRQNNFGLIVLCYTG